MHVYDDISLFAVGVWLCCAWICILQLLKSYIDLMTRDISPLFLVWSVSGLRRRSRRYFRSKWIFFINRSCSGLWSNMLPSLELIAMLTLDIVHARTNFIEPIHDLISLSFSISVIDALSLIVCMHLYRTWSTTYGDRNDWFAINTCMNFIPQFTWRVIDAMTSNWPNLLYHYTLIDMNALLWFI